VVAALGFVATAIATVFAQATLVRFTRDKRRYDRAWTVALAMYAAASAALATGESTGWDSGTFRVFYLFGAALNVPWLALGSVELLFGEKVGRRATGAVLLFTGLAAGVVMAAPIEGTIEPADGIPSGKELFDAGPRVIAAVGSGVGATVVLALAVWSAARYLVQRDVVGARRLAASNVLIALGVLVASSGGLLHGLVGEDEAFAISTVVAISVIYAGFLLATKVPRETRLRIVPAPTVDAAASSAAHSRA
jgi:hypothetical protein